MAFDKNDNRPIVQVGKSTTQVNGWIILAVCVFVLAGILAIAWMHKHPNEVTHSVRQDVNPAPKP